MTAIASLPEPRDVDDTLLELEYRIRLEMFTRRQDARSCACLLHPARDIASCQRASFGDDARGIELLLEPVRIAVVMFASETRVVHPGGEHATW